MSLYLNHCADVRGQADAAAEREAAALEWFQRELGQPETLPRLRREREIREAAAERGIDPPPHPRYPRGAAIRSWFRILDAIAEGAAPAVKPVRFDPSTRAARARRSAEYRATRAACLKALPAGESAVSVARAAELLGMSRSGAEKAVYGWRLPHRKCGRRTVVPVDALLAFSHKRLAVAA